MRPLGGFEGLDAPPEAERAGRAILDAAFAVHSALGPGATEATYARFMERWLVRRNHKVERELWIPVSFDGEVIPNALRLDTLVDAAAVVELKAVESLSPLHEAQLLAYLRVGGYSLGYLLNFHAPRLRQGIRRYVNTRKVQ